MTREELLESVHKRLVEHAEDVAVRVADARTSPMSARMLFAAAKELLADAALLAALHKLSDDDG